MRIQHNIMAMNAYRNYGNNTSALSKNLEKLSSGYRINRAGDDAAGLAISEKMRAQIQGLNAAQKNVKDAISFVKTAEGAMQEIQDMLSRMKYLATQSANGTYEDTVDRNALQDEVNSLLSEIDRIAESANFNDIHMLYGEDAEKKDSVGAGGKDPKMQVTGIKATAGKNETGATVAFAFDTNATQEQKDALAKALKDVTLSIVAKDDGTNEDDTLSAGDKVTITGLPSSGYSYTYTKGDNKGEAPLPSNGELGVGSNSSTDGGFINGSAPITITVKDDKGATIGTITITGAQDKKSTTGSTTEITFEAEEEEVKEEKVAKSYTVDITGKDGVDGLVSGDKITINGKDYDIAANGTDPSKIDGSTVTKFEDQIKAAIELYNKESGEDWTAEYKDGKLTFTVKDGKEPTAAPTFGITEAAPGTFVSKIGDVTAASSGSDWQDQGDPTYFNINMQIGDSSNKYDTMTISIRNMSQGSLGITGLNIANIDDAMEAIDTVKNAINIVSSVRGNLGAYQNRLEHTANNLSVMTENIQDAESTIRDTDVAEEMMSYTKNNILIQSAQAMLAQANAVPQGVLQLLG